MKNITLGSQRQGGGSGRSKRAKWLAKGEQAVGHKEQRQLEAAGRGQIETCGGCGTPSLEADILPVLALLLEREPIKVPHAGAAALLVALLGVLEDRLQVAGRDGAEDIVWVRTVLAKVLRLKGLHQVDLLRPLRNRLLGRPRVVRVALVLVALLVLGDLVVVLLAPGANLVCHGDGGRRTGLGAGGAWLRQRVGWRRLDVRFGLFVCMVGSVLVASSERLAADGLRRGGGLRGGLPCCAIRPGGVARNQGLTGPRGIERHRVDLGLVEGGASRPRGHRGL
mmetsp:Transcript_17365/g.44037  ORF Transcript_17365/g.44037 Transcript_17365/m.44037 type:complete len:281 (+) Transcript_17365:2-844(+)